MFLVIFGSLAAAMAVVAQGNLRTADSALRVSRATSAAETGLIFAAERMQSEARRFVITKGVIEADFAGELQRLSDEDGSDDLVDGDDREHDRRKEIRDRGEADVFLDQNDEPDSDAGLRNEREAEVATDAAISCLP